MNENTEFSQRIMPHCRKIFAVAYRFLLRSDEAEDAVQDVLAKLWQKRESLPPDQDLLPYILTMTRNLCIDRLRARQSLAEISDFDQLTKVLSEEALTNETSSFEDKDRLKHLMKLIRQLPADQQKVLKLSAMDDLNTAQIASITGFSSENIRQILSRARRKLKESALKQGLI